MDRHYKREETELHNRIRYLENQIKSEKRVNETIRMHLQSKQKELIEKGHRVDEKKDKQAEQMVARENELMQKQNDTVAEFEQLKVKLSDDDDLRAERALQQGSLAAEEAEKLRIKHQMSDAAA